MAANLEIAGALKRTQKGDADWYYGGGDEAWVSLTAAKAGVPAAVRPGKTVGVYVSGAIVEYWWPTTAVADTDLVAKDPDLSGKANITYVDSQDAASLVTARAYADALLVSVYKDCGNWDASGGIFPTTGGTGTSGAIKKGNAFEISVAGTTAGEAFDVGDIIRALIDAPGQTLANWARSEHNTQQATEATRGTAKVVDQTTIQTETSTDDQAVVTTKKFWFGIARLAAIAQTITGNWNFTGTLKQNSNTVETQNNKDASSGYTGLTLFKINFKNTLNTFTSFFTNSNTAARTYTFPDRDGTMADNTDLAAKYDKAGGDLNAEAYIGIAPSSSTPATPSTGIKLYFKSGLTWLGTNGFSRTFSGSGLTASRVFSLPDADGSLALNNYTLFFQNPCTQFQDYFKNAAAIKTIVLKSNVATYQYSTNNGSTWTTPTLPLSANITITADTILTHKITYSFGYATALVYIELA